MATGSYTWNLDIGDEDDVEVTVEWEGYYEPASGMGGAWENSHPASGEMGIIVVHRVDNGHSYEPTLKQMERLIDQAWDEYHGI